MPTLTSDPRLIDFILFMYLHNSDVAVSSTGNAIVASVLHGGAELDRSVYLPNDSDGVVVSFTRDGIKR